MSRSQRHKTYIENYPSDCKIASEGMVSPGYMRQLPGPFVVPVGPPGGPLQGSSLAGPAPAGALPTGDLLKLLLLGGIVAGGGPVNPPEAESPVLDTLSPNTAELGSDDVIMICHGSNFTPSSVIHFAEHDEPTTFVDANTVTTGVKPSLGWGPGPQPVYVKTGGLVSDTVEFTFTEAAPAPSPLRARPRRASKCRSCRSRTSLDLYRRRATAPCRTTSRRCPTTPGYTAQSCAASGRRWI